MPDDDAPPPPPAPEPVPAPPPPPEPVLTPPVTVAPPYGAGKLSASDDKTFCLLSHVLAIVAGFLAPLLFWLLKKDESPAVEAHAKESLNFQLTIVGLFIISIILSVATCGALSFLPFVVMLYDVVLCVLAGVKANEGQLFRYPLTWRLVK